MLMTKAKLLTLLLEDPTPDDAPIMLRFRPMDAPHFANLVEIPLDVDHVEGRVEKDVSAPLVLSLDHTAQDVADRFRDMIRARPQLVQQKALEKAFKKMSASEQDNIRKSLRSLFS